VETQSDTIVTVSWKNTRTVTDEYTDVKVPLARLRALIGEHAPRWSDDVGQALDDANIWTSDFVPIMAAIAAESRAMPVSTVSDEDITDVEHDTAEFVCVDCNELVSAHCEECGECECECEDEDEDDDE